MNYKDKKLAILGCGKSGIAASRLAVRKGACVDLFDTGSSDDLNSKAESLSKEGIKVFLGEGGICDNPNSYELVVVSPGISLDWDIVKPFRSAGKKIISEIEFSYSFCNSEIVGVTGTNGKTTTVELIGKILEGCGRTVAVGGNHGRPFADIIIEDKNYSTIVLEISSFQLEAINEFCPHIAVWTNFAADHLDRYSSIDEYRDAKLNIFINQTDEDWAIVNGLEKPNGLKAQTVTFSVYNELSDYRLNGSKIANLDNVLLDQSLTKLRGLHNAENLMAAIAVAKIHGFENKEILDSIMDYKAPAHRCELVLDSNGIQFINDSKATNLHAVASALNSFRGQNIVLIAGGKNKGISYSDINTTVNSGVSSAVLFGENRFEVAEEWKEETNCVLAQDLDEAVKMAIRLVGNSGIVLFSPGTSSFDMFNGYEDRGNFFIESVMRNFHPKNNYDK